eukprot:CAMPEP_0197825644 /NCGR_PEP_ID=MMETSP1437-20131217/2695_1 /TAXON_ID=49252 ORGANISM="Eucampia antarctica, Strain CCMP1452" /NCGR_SAMPLE_ID=MMETSP1437 /ASSEMBLY_ACC=CAM_ASM_001096 /LENGTH=331 /DNA_ID=CAMNT_0043425733 /DNA_START=250 /DNA_END=1242 /DNA_ORIENTATION=-
MPTRLPPKPPPPATAGHSTMDAINCATIPPLPLKPSLPSTSERDVHHAVTDATVPLPGHASPLAQTRLSYSELGSVCGDKRDAVLHATPSRGCASPKKKLQRQASDASNIRRICTDVFSPVVRHDSPSTVIPLGLTTAVEATPKRTPSSRDQQNNSSVRTRKRSSAAKDQGKQKNKEKPPCNPNFVVTKQLSKTKQKPTREKNRTMCINSSIHKCARPDAFASKKGNLKIDNAGFEKYYAKMKRQIDHRFKRINVTAAERKDAIGLGLRSSKPKEESIFDNEALMAETTNIKRLSRYHWEDLLSLKTGGDVVLYCSNLQKWMMSTKTMKLK